MKIQLSLYNLMKMRYSYSYLFQMTMEMIEISKQGFTKSEIENMYPYEREGYYKLYVDRRKEEEKRAKEEADKNKIKKIF